MTRSPLRVAVFASGGGSNLGALLDAIDRGAVAARVTVVVVDRGGIGAIDRAVAAGIDVRMVVPSAYPSDVEFGDTLLSVLRAAKADLVVLAGYLRRIPRAVVERYDGRLVNVHPALLPEFGGAGMYGARVHAAVLASGATVSGCTVHLVDADYDTGPILAQVRVPVRPDDTPETLAARVLAEEHRLLPAVVATFARDDDGGEAA